MVDVHYTLPPFLLYFILSIYTLKHINRVVIFLNQTDVIFVKLIQT